MAKSSTFVSYNFSQVDVLVIEENLFTRRLLAGMLRAFNFRRVQVFGDSESAFGYFCANPVDIVLAGWGPRSEELYFLQMARTDKESPKTTVPIIVVTAFSDQKYVVRARDLGMNEYLTLPLSVDTLYHRLCAVVEHPRSFIRAPGFYGPDRRRRIMRYSGEDRRKNDPVAEETEENTSADDAADDD